MADENKPKLTPEQEQAKRDEDAAVERAKKALEENKALVGTALPMYDPLWLVKDPVGREVLKKSLGKDPKTNQPYPVSDRVVTAIIPRDITLTLDHHHKVELPRGIREIPECLMQHPWLRAQGVMAYSGPPPVAATAPNPPAGYPPTFPVGGRDVNSAPFVTAAFAYSELSVEDWNKLSDEERDAMVMTEVGKAQAASGEQQGPIKRNATQNNANPMKRGG